MFVTQILPLILGSLAIAVTGQVILKVGMGQVKGGLPEGAGAVAMLTRAFTNPIVVVGLFAYVMSAALWLLVLSKADLSQVYPFAGLTVATVAIASAFILKEPMTPVRWIGTAIVVIGVTIVSRG